MDDSYLDAGAIAKAFRDANSWPLLSGHSFSSLNWIEEIGPIQNAVLMVENAEISSSDEESNNDPQKPFMEKSRLRSRLEKARLRREIDHEKDYFLLGSNAWLILKSKFGCDLELERKCVLWNRSESPIAVEVLPAEDGQRAVYVPVPPTGRFAYEQVLSAAVNKPAYGAPAAVKHPGNVSDDDTAASGDDLYPGHDDDDHMSTDKQEQNAGSTVLLLPPSTTSYPAKTTQPWLEKNDYSRPAVKRKPYGSGLGNLGNTCFMNSTLQCLAHTDPLRKYFLSGEYERDLNRDNPLGTGGDLATQFAHLLGEMWGVRETVSNSYSGSSAVYPRSFKYALGRHAEQFVGYDQHDSQELATYLLDAIHEDTNRVTKKPYVEKAEQGENETDEEAADKAWEFHLQREDSRVLEFFMGQVKSRVQCCKTNCGRVSTTFDPFMFLSVPIPGSLERRIRVVYVPNDDLVLPQEVHVSIQKNATIRDLLVKLVDQLKKGGVLRRDEDFEMDDLCAVDVWQREIYSFYKESDEIDRIRDTDDTFIYQLSPRSTIEAEDTTRKVVLPEVDHAKVLGLRDRSPHRKYQLDLASLTRLNRGDAWVSEAMKYLKSGLGFTNAFHPTKGTADDRVKWYNKFCRFLDTCYQDAENDTSGQKRSWDETTDSQHISVSPDEDPIPTIQSHCDESGFFKEVSRRQDLAVLEFVTGKMRAEILRMEHQHEFVPGGIILQVRIRKQGFGKEQNFVAPLLLRISSATTVYELRTILAKRLKRSIALYGEKPSSAGQSTSERDVADVRGDAMRLGQSSAQLLVLRQVPLTYEKKVVGGYKNIAGTVSQLGSLAKDTVVHEGNRPVTLASPEDEAEKALVASLAGDRGVVYMEWPELLVDRYFNVAEYETFDRVNDVDESNGRTRRSTKSLNVLDCIEKYCQMEQLESSEMWYCSKCKEHVRAWKQFHIYRSPPILIVHLKRFQYSATTHRRDKINLFVDFPLEGLDLTQQVMHWNDSDKPIYDCYAVSNHYGGLGGGHYTAYALNDDGVWCHYDDSRITTHVDQKEVVSQAAYVLYYRRRDVPVGEDFIMNLQTQGVLTPTLIQDPLDKLGGTSDDHSGSNVAMVDEDEAMDLDENDMASRPNSPIESSFGPDQFDIRGGDRDDDDHNGDNTNGHFPLQ